MTSKEIIRNRFFARTSENYQEYQVAGGTGTKQDYHTFCQQNKAKARMLENIIKERWN